VTDVQVREAAPADAAELRRLAAEAVPAEVVAAGGTVEPERTEEVIAADKLFVAQAEHHIAGYVAVTEGDEELVVDQLVIASTDEGRGVGNLLLDWAEGYGVSRSKRSIRVVVEEDNQRALGFYQRRGYARAAAGGMQRELAHQP
jgi:ribosomal protein S18 acetylase RimI-like enzyme